MSDGYAYGVCGLCSPTATKNGLAWLAARVSSRWPSEAIHSSLLPAFWVVLSEHQELPHQAAFGGHGGQPTFCCPWLLYGRPQL